DRVPLRAKPSRRNGARGTRLRRRMALSGNGAMVLYYDIVREVLEDHDDWHTHEHFPERVGIPGFLRASRWVTLGDGPRYLVVYEVEEVGVLSDAPYLERLNNP